MKIIIIFSIILFSVGCKDAYKQEEGVLYEGQKIAMPKEYRRITGYDSIQVLYYEPGNPLGNGWEANFCYPNKYEFEKFKNKTDTSTIVGHVWNQSITLPTTLASSDYVIRFMPHSYTEPVSALPLAIILVFGTLFIIALIGCAYEYIISKIKK